MRRRVLLAIPGLLLAASAFAASEPPDWPREYRNERGLLLVYQPQVTAWDDHSLLHARIAVAFAADESETPALGSVSVTVDTEANLEERQVKLSNLEIVESAFPSVDGPRAWQLTQDVKAVFPEETVVALERVTAALERGRQQREVEVKVDPPLIFVSRTPAILVMLDGEPLWSPIEGSELKYAINTNWDLFELEDVHYLRNEDSWLKASDLGGPWMPAGKLPKPFKKLSKKDPNWKDVRDSLPGRKIDESEVPGVYVSEAPAELILTEGEPELKMVDGTRLLWVENSESDLFLSNEDGRFYYLVSGRWFRSQKLEGPWSFATPELPEDFSKIPDDHPRAHVRASVPGTPEADQAVLQARIPKKATVERGKVRPEVSFGGDPEFQPIEGTSMHYAVNTPNDIIRVGDLYYLCFQAVWFVSSKPEGPWELADDIPDEIYTIPASSPVHHTTHVEVYDSTPTTVVYGYTSGYWGVYFSYGCLMFGTGWYYPPYYYWGGGYPIYYPYPYSYGVSAYYNPHTGTYGRGVWGYGPYGGFGYGARYNPSTGTYARGGAAYGPYNYGAWAEAYNPRTDTYARTRQGGNAYSNWGTSAVRRGDDWARTAHYRGEDGGFAGYRGSDGSSGFIGRNENNVYAGKDGNVYRRNEDGWQQYNDGEWDSVDRPEGDRAEARGDRASTDREAARDRAAAADRAGKAARPDRGTMDQLDRDARSRQQGSQRAQSSRSWRSSPSAGSFGRGGYGGMRGGRGRR